jgi:hypothetical protein
MHATTSRCGYGILPDPAVGFSFVPEEWLGFRSVEEIPRGRRGEWQYNADQSEPEKLKYQFPAGWPMSWCHPEKQALSLGTFRRRARSAHRAICCHFFDSEVFAGMCKFQCSGHCSLASTKTFPINRLFSVPPNVKM